MDNNLDDRTEELTEDDNSRNLEIGAIVRSALVRGVERKFISFEGLANVLRDSAVEFDGVDDDVAVLCRDLASAIDDDTNNEDMLSTLFSKAYSGMFGPKASRYLDFLNRIGFVDRLIEAEDRRYLGENPLPVLLLKRVLGGRALAVMGLIKRNGKHE